MKKKIAMALITGVACGTLLFTGCGDDKAKNTDNSSSSSSSVTTSNTSPSSNTPKENKKSLSAAEKKTKIDELARGMDVKKDDMTDMTTYTGPSIQQSIPILRQEIAQKGHVPSYRLCAAKDDNGNKVLIEIVEFDSAGSDMMEDRLVMKSKNKLYTTEYNTFDGNTQSFSDMSTDIFVSGVKSVAKDSRIKEIREAVDSGYIKIRVSDVSTHNNFDRELTSDEINMLSKVLQIYDLL